MWSLSVISTSRGSKSLGFLYLPEYQYSYLCLLLAAALSVELVRLRLRLLCLNTPEMNNGKNSVNNVVIIDKADLK